MIFEDLQGTTVFEIPIYALSPKEHRSRYKRKISSETKKLWEQGVFGETAEKKAKQFCQHLSQWKYNQLVGMFCLSINNIDPNCDNSLLCHLYCNESFPRTISSHSYLPFKNRYLIYEKIYLNNITNDEELITAIKEKIEFLKIQHDIKNSYFDCTALEKMISLSKIKSILADT